MRPAPREGPPPSVGPPPNIEPPPNDGFTPNDGPPLASKGLLPKDGGPPLMDGAAAKPEDWPAEGGDENPLPSSEVPVGVGGERR